MYHEDIQIIIFNQLDMNRCSHEFLYNVVFVYLDFYDKHKFQKINKYMNTIHVKDLFNLNNDVLKNYKYVVKLYACNNIKITNINHMAKLKELDASCDCGIGDGGILDLTNLEILNAHSNSKRTDINHMTKIIELNACSTCGINNRGILNPSNLEILNVQYNIKITNINYIKN